MDATIYALVDAKGTVYADEYASSYDEVADAHGLDEKSCDRYRFDLVERRLIEDRGTAASRRAARGYFDSRCGSPEKLIAFAQEGRLSKQVLARLLPNQFRHGYLEACAATERQFTDTCASAGGCLESGCSMSEGEGCLQPLENASTEYHHACAVEWAKLFASPRHRIESWVR